MKRILCAVLAVICIASLGGAFAEAADDPVVIRVGEFTYSKSLVEFTMHSAADLNGFFWELLDQEQKEVIRDTVIEQIIGIGIIESKLQERGQHDFTEAEQELLRASAQNQYDQTWQHLYQYLTENEVDVTRQQVSQWLDSMGYTVDMYYLSVMAAERQFRMFDLFCDPVNPTDDEVDAFYLEKFVEPDREKYENDIAAYEKDVLLGENESFYIPEGYRLIKWVIVPIPDDVALKAKPYNAKVSMVEAEAVAAYNALAAAAATVEDFNELKPYREEYDRASQELLAASEELIEKLNQGLPEAERVKAKIEKQLSEGMTFDHALRLYDDEQMFADPDKPGIPFHPDSPNWTGNMYKSVAALTEPGQLSEPMLAQEGMYIFYYESDIPGGAHVLTAEQRELAAQNAVYTVRLNQLMELIEGWKQDYAITVDLSLIGLD